MPSYTQPYALLFAGLIVLIQPRAITGLPQLDRLMLGYLAVLGTLLIAFEALNGISFREISHWLSYVSPFLITAAAFLAIRISPDMMRKALIYGIFVWVGVGVIQTLVNPGFLTFLASESETLGFDVVQSGRGVLGLAPEPTHYGFYMLILAAALAALRGPVWVIALAVVASITLARSSSALVACLLGLVVWASLNPLKRIWVFGGLLLVIITSSVIPLIFDDSFRITRLILTVYSLGSEIVLIDFSINARVSGLIMPFKYSFEQFLIPQGIGSETWTQIRTEILAENTWIIGLSGNGPASGVGMIFLQGGFLSLPVVFYLGYRLVLSPKNYKLVGLGGAVVFIVFCNQLYLSNPGLGLVIAAVIHYRRTAKTALDPRQVQRPQDYESTGAASIK